VPDGNENRISALSAAKGAAYELWIAATVVREWEGNQSQNKSQ
jgi:hypothetical protein